MNPLWLPIGKTMGAGRLWVPVPEEPEWIPIGKAGFKMPNKTYRRGEIVVIDELPLGSLWGPHKGCTAQGKLSLARHDPPEVRCDGCGRHLEIEILC